MKKYECHMPDDYLRAGINHLLTQAGKKQNWLAVQMGVSHRQINPFFTERQGLGILYKVMMCDALGVHYVDAVQQGRLLLDGIPTGTELESELESEKGDLSLMRKIMNDLMTQLTDLKAELKIRDMEMAELKKAVSRG